MDVSSVSDCVLLDNTIPTIALEETLNDIESGEDVSQDGEDLEMEEEVDQTKFTKKRLMLIVFPDADNLQKLGPELIEFMQQKVPNLGVDLDNERSEICFFEKVVGSSEQDQEEEEETPMFTIDSTPSKGKPASADIPRYTQSFTEALSNDNAKNKKEDGGARRAQSCFNCDGDHNLRECTEPRNHQKINANRKSRGGKTERYHVDLSQKYGHLRPGKISKKLSKALGLKSKDLPLHVFRMRKLGYPPGWLEEAKVSHSGINLFGSDGVVVLEDDDEDGEVEQVKDKFDPTKIIEYPGFNVDPPEDAYDDAKHFDCPPMQEDHRKDTFLANLGVNLATAYKRRKMDSFPMNDTLTNAEAVDMDIADADDEEGELSKSPPPPPPEETENGSMQPPPPPPPATADDNKEEAPAEVSSSTAGVNDSLVDFILTRDENESIPEVETKDLVEEKSKVENRLLASKEMVEGTPLLKSASPYDKLPEGDKWAVGVSDVINFENLPDSVGKYEKMKVLIKKVQTVVKQINNE